MTKTLNNVRNLTIDKAVISIHKKTAPPPKKKKIPINIVYLIIKQHHVIVLFNLNTNYITVYLAIKSERASDIIFFSEYICSCCRVSTICFFFKHFNAKVLDRSAVNCT